MDKNDFYMFQHIATDNHWHYDHNCSLSEEHNFFSATHFNMSQHIEIILNCQVLNTTVSTYIKQSARVSHTAVNTDTVNTSVHVQCIDLPSVL